MFNSWSTSVNPNGLSFAAQPPVFAKDVRLQLLTSAIVVAPSSRVLIKRRLDASGPSLAQMNVRFYLPSPQPKVNTPNAPQPESDHMTLAHGVTITAPPLARGELVLCGGEGRAAVPPIPAFPRAGGKGSSDTPPERGPIWRGAVWTDVRRRSRRPAARELHPWDEICYAKAA
jgi:hypothetical protein